MVSALTINGNKHLQTTNQILISWNFQHIDNIYAKDNIPFVKLYMRESFAEVLQVSVKTSALDFISNIGGLMGLCMGFSLVTVAEILYHGLDAVWVKFFSSGKRVGTFVRRDNRRIAAQP